MKTLVFETCLTGHRLEYLHHIYMGACDRKDETFIFVVPKHFKDKKANLVWPENENIHFRFIPDNVATKVESEKNLIKSSYLHTRLLRKYANEEQTDHILLISLMNYMPWLAFLQLKSQSIRGIIYKIYLYNEFLGVRKLINKAIYNLFAHRRTMDKIFILNDAASANRLNEIYHTSNFQFLPDPVPSIDRKEVNNIRKDLSVKPSDNMYLHFGGLSERKGTLVILEAIATMSAEELRNKIFVFAGSVYDEIKDRFYALKDDLSKKSRIIVYDEFCPYSLLNNLCESCDAILIPYLSTSHSSGVIGYASFFNKPLIGPSRGLIGYLIKEYNMGMMLDDINSEKLKEAICGDLPAHSNDYNKTHKVDDFTFILLS